VNKTPENIINEKQPIQEELKNLFCETSKLFEKRNTDNYPVSGLSSAQFSHYNAEKAKSTLTEFANGKAIFSCTNKDKVVKAPSQSNLSFKITKDKDSKATFSDFSDQPNKIQSNKANIGNSVSSNNNTNNNINNNIKPEVNDFQIPKTSYILNSEQKPHDIIPTTFGQYSKIEKKDRRFKMIDGTSNIKYLLSKNL